VNDALSASGTGVQEGNIGCQRLRMHVAPESLTVGIVPLAKPDPAWLITCVTPRHQHAHDCNGHNSGTTFGCSLIVRLCRSVLVAFTAVLAASVL